MTLSKKPILKGLQIPDRNLNDLMLNLHIYHRETVESIDIRCFQRCCLAYIRGFSRLDLQGYKGETPMKYFEDEMIAGVFLIHDKVALRSENTSLIWDNPKPGITKVILNKRDRVVGTGDERLASLQGEAFIAVKQLLGEVLNIPPGKAQWEPPFPKNFLRACEEHRTNVLEEGSRATLKVFYSPDSYLNVEFGNEISERVLGDYASVHYFLKEGR